MSAKTCSVEGCDLNYYAKGYCNPHYSRLRHHGTTDLLKPDISSPRGEKTGSIHVALDEHARSLLATMARRERRRMNDQAAIVIRRGLGLPDFETRRQLGTVSYFGRSQARIVVSRRLKKE